MLIGIDAALTGPLLAHLDAMGHGDALVVADAHFPAVALGRRVIELPGLGSPRVLAAVHTLVPFEPLPSIALLRSGEPDNPDVQRELIEAASVTSDDVAFLDRDTFYELASSAFVVLRTGEIRPYGNAIVRKDVVARSPVD